MSSVPAAEGHLGATAAARRAGETMTSASARLSAEGAASLDRLAGMFGLPANVVGVLAVELWLSVDGWLQDRRAIIRHAGDGAVEAHGPLGLWLEGERRARSRDLVAGFDVRLAASVASALAERVAATRISTAGAIEAAIAHLDGVATLLAGGGHLSVQADWTPEAACLTTIDVPRLVQCGTDIDPENVPQPHAAVLGHALQILFSDPELFTLAPWDTRRAIDMVVEEERAAPGATRLLCLLAIAHCFDEGLIRAAADHFFPDRSLDGPVSVDRGSPGERLQVGVPVSTDFPNSVMNLSRGRWEVNRAMRALAAYLLAHDYADVASADGSSPAAEMATVIDEYLASPSAPPPDRALEPMRLVALAYRDPDAALTELRRRVDATLQDDSTPSIMERLVVKDLVDDVADILVANPRLVRDTQRLQRDLTVLRWLAFSSGEQSTEAQRFIRLDPATAQLLERTLSPPVVSRLAAEPNLDGLVGDVISAHQHAVQYEKLRAAARTL